jgi:anaerobic magnesium-protoporphyrin IX monomethyl ester cyclase
LIRDLNSLPIPSYELLPTGKYYSASTNKRYMVLFTDRGCPYSCSFCASAAQMKYRFLSVDNVILHLKKLVVDLEVEWVEFMDLTFTINKRRTIELCKKIVEENLVFDWACETRADLLSDELLDWMKKAGCKKITIGVESGNEELRIETGKKISDECFKEVFEKCDERGIKVMANYIFGHPNETMGTAWETIMSSIKLKPFNVLFTKMTPLPDVDLFKKLLADKEIEADLWYQYMKGEILFPVYYPSKIGKRKMEFMYRMAFIIFYCRPVSFLKFGRMMTDFRFLKRSIFVWGTFVFGKTIYK